MDKYIVVAIDGPAGAGKSTVARRLARELGFSFLDTGAMYRSLTLKAIRVGLNLEDEEALVALARETTLQLKQIKDGVQVLLDGRDVSQEIRSLDVTNKTFYIARAPRVREIMVKWQREIAGQQSVVAEGRDTTTVVFPKATNKFYLDASADERARRRHKELVEKGQTVDLDQLKQEIVERDEKDMNRSVGALKKAEDAVYVDTSLMTIDDVVSTLKKHILG